MTQLEKIKTLLGITSTDKDDVLNLLIEDATEFVKAFCHNDSVPESAINDVVVYRFATMGNDGVKSESYSGVSFSYENDLPAHIIRHLKAHRKVIFK